MLVMSDSFGFVYPGKKSYKGELLERIRKRYGAFLADKATFLPISGATLPDLLSAAMGMMKDTYFDVVVFASFGNELIDSRHRVTDVNLQSVTRALSAFKEFSPSTTRTLMIYGGPGRLWFKDVTAANTFDDLCAKLRIHIQDQQIRALDGGEVSRLVKHSDFHFSVSYKSEIVNVWTIWIDEALRTTRQGLVAPLPVNPPPGCGDSPVGPPQTSQAPQLDLMNAHAADPPENHGPNLLEMSKEEVGALHAFIEANLFVGEPVELIEALRDDGMLLGAPWRFITKYLHVIFGRLRRQGYNVPRWLSAMMVGTAMDMHLRSSTPPSSASDLCRGCGLGDAAAVALKQVRQFCCKECRKPGEEAETFPRRRRTPKEDMPPCSHRWCEGCWFVWRWGVLPDKEEPNPWSSIPGVEILYSGTLLKFQFEVQRYLEAGNDTLNSEDWDGEEYWDGEEDSDGEENWDGVEDWDGEENWVGLEDWDSKENWEPDDRCLSG